MRVPCFFILLVLGFLSGCSVSGEVYPEPPSDPVMPVVDPESIAEYRIELSVDGHRMVERAPQVIQQPAASHPRNMDLIVEILVTGDPGLDTIQFERNITPINWPEPLGVQMLYRQSMFEDHGLVVFQWEESGGPPSRLHAIEFEEWSMVRYSYDAIEGQGYGNYTMRGRIRFESPWPEWDFRDSYLALRFKDGAVKWVPIFSSE